MAGEEAGEISGILKSHGIADFCDGEVGLEERGEPCGAGAGVAERGFTDAQRAGVGSDGLALAETLFDPLAKTGDEEGLAAAAAGAGIGQGGVAQRLDHETEEERFDRRALPRAGHASSRASAPMRVSTSAALVRTMARGAWKSGWRSASRSSRWRR